MSQSTASCLSGAITCPTVVGGENMKQSETPPTEQELIRADDELSALNAEELTMAPVYRYIDAESGDELDPAVIVWDEAELSDGAVLHTHPAVGSKQYYTVASMHEEEPVEQSPNGLENTQPDTAPVITVKVTKARNIIWKVFLLGGLLTAGWFVLDYVFSILM